MIVTPMSRNKELAEGQVSCMNFAVVSFESFYVWVEVNQSLIQAELVMSVFARELAQLLHYDIKLSTTYHPQTNEQSEQTNQEIEIYLHIFSANNSQKWMDFLPTAEFHYNSISHSFTKVSSFSLLHKYKSWVYPFLEKTFLPILENCLAILEEAWTEALAAHKTAY